MKYPDSWREEISTSPNNAVASLNLAYATQVTLTPDQPCQGCVIGGRVKGIYINIFENSNNLPSKEYVIKLVLIRNERSSAGNIILNQPSYFSSLDAIVVDSLPGAGNPGLTAYIKNKNDQIIELMSDGIDTDTTNAIFSTFKFIP